MKKKFLALVLTLAMVLSLVPATALAAGDESTRVGTVQSDGNNGVKVIKTATPGDNGNATINMEAYVTGTVETTTQYTPLDIVLVLDQSGSMAGNRLKRLKTAATNFINTITADATKHNVNHRIAVVGFASGDSSGGEYYRNTELFIGATQYNYMEDGNGSTHNTEGNLAADHYKDAFQKVTDEIGKSNLTQSIKKLDAEGGTHPEFGMAMANGIFAANPDTTGTRQRIVVMFTDGEPGNNGFDDTVADATVAEAYTTKDTYDATVYTVGLISNPGDKVTKFLSKVSSNYPDAQAYEGPYSHSPVYANGLNTNSKYYVEDYNGYIEVYYYNGYFKEGWCAGEFPYRDWYTPKTSADDNEEGHTQFYSRQETTTAQDTKYYMHTGDADELNKIFTNIAQDTTHASVEVGNTSEMRDELSKFFVFDGIECNDGTVTKGVTVTKVAAKGSGSEPEWATIGKNITKNVTVKVVDDKITVTGFNYSNDENCVVKKTGGNWKGYKLVLSFDVKPNVDCYDWTNADYFDTNQSGAGLYYGEGNQTGTVVSTPKATPEVHVPTYKVTYDWGNIKNATSVTDEQYYINEQTAQVKDTVQKGTAVQGTDGQWYRFKGWSESENGTVVDKVVIENDNVTLTPVLTEAYTVTYTDGVENEEVFADQVYSNLINGEETPAFNGTPTRNGYKFTGWEPAVADTVNGNATYTAQWEKEEVPYTVIFNANGGAWKADGIPEYTIDGQNAVKNDLTVSDRISNVSGYLTETDKFLGWAATSTATQEDAIVAFSVMSPTVAQLKQWTNTDGHTITLYAIWKDVPQSAYTYTIRQHFMKDEKQELGAQNYIKLKEVQAGTEISTLIPSDTRVEFDGRTYLYEANNTTVNNQKYEGTEEITGKDTVIDLYYYLDSWEDGDIDPDDKTDDSLTDGDGIPDCKQILIQYQVYQEGNGLVNPEFEVVTVKDNKDNKELTAIHGSSVTRTGTGYTFVTWTGQNVAVTEKTVGNIIKETSAEKLKKEKCDLSKDTFEQGKSYTYTAIFLEDKIGGGDNKDQPDGIPDAWQYKVTFKVANGKWNDQTSADVVAYVTNKKDGTPCAKDTKGSKATLDGVTIPVAGSQPDSGYKASGNWNTTPSATTVINKEDTVFTYTYDKKSGGSGGSGGSHKPTVTIPDDVPTGLNGKDHYAYVVGYPDGMVYPQKNITRAEVATIFFRLLKDETREANMTKSNGYNDMKDGAWYTCAVSTLSKMGIIKGYEDGSFKPDASISRAEFAAIAARFDPDGDKTPATFSDVSSHWAKDEISIAANHGWIKGYEDGSFKPDQKITRAETMTLVNRVLKRLPETKDDLHKDMKTWPDNQKESAWFYLAVQEATNSHYQKLKKDGTHETWESMRETRDWAALEK